MAKGITRLYSCVKKFREINPEIPSQQIAMLLRIAMFEGVTLPDLAESLGTTVASISRNAKVLSVHINKDGERSGFALIELRPDLYERRRLACFLTDKGKELMAELNDIIEEN